MAPIDILGILQRQSTFSAHNQHDAQVIADDLPLSKWPELASACRLRPSSTDHFPQEALSYILDMLHEDLNRITVKPYVEVSL